MKVIDLLNKIANGEEVPEKIKYVNIIWCFNKKYKTYYMNNTEIELFYIEKLTNKLNDEIEIIDKKIPEKIGVINYVEDPATALIHNKVDEIIDYLNYKGGKDEKNN